jgi:hypothetical protein
LVTFNRVAMSCPSEHKKSLTVKIQLPEDRENVLAVNFPNTFSVKSLKDDIAKKFKILSDQLLVHQDDCEIEDSRMLHSLNLNDFGIIEIKLRLSDHAISERVSLDTSVYYSSFTLPDIITVHIPTENEAGEITTRDLVVEIENKSIKKPFIGGFVHKTSSEVKVASSASILALIAHLVIRRNRVPPCFHPDRSDIRPNQEGQRLKVMPRNADHRVATKRRGECLAHSLAVRSDFYR